jgi:hypothetical protein
VIKKKVKKGADKGRVVNEVSPSLRGLQAEAIHLGYKLKMDFRVASLLAMTN